MGHEKDKTELSNSELYGELLESFFEAAVKLKAEKTAKKIIKLETKSAKGEIKSMVIPPEGIDVKEAIELGKDMHSDKPKTKRKPKPKKEPQVFDVADDVRGTW